LSHLGHIYHHGISELVGRRDIDFWSVRRQREFVLRGWFNLGYGRRDIDLWSLRWERELDLHRRFGLGRAGVHR
jgi:hypothetical protein